jgi:glycosyltransferase involved in cell wall biosynthesis
VRKSLRVLHLISSGGLYGAENVIIHLALALKRLNCEVVIGVFQNRHRPNTEIAETARQNGLEVAVFECQGKLDFGTVRAIHSFICERELDILHTHGYKADIYGYRAARKTRAGLVATGHSWPGKSAMLRLYSLLDHVTLRWFDHICVVSSGVADSLRHLHIPSEKITVVDNGIDVGHFSGGQAVLREELGLRENPLVGFVGRLAPEKGLEHLLRAAAGILSTSPSAKFILAGEGSERSTLENLARQLGIEKSVIFLGRRSDLANIYASFDLFVLPSLSEGMPLAVLEAMAAKKPVVATRVGAITKMVKEHETGLLVDAGDIVGLQSAISLLLGRSDLCRTFGQNGHEVAKSFFSADSMAKIYSGIYRRVISRPSNTPTLAYTAADRT